MFQLVLPEELDAALAKKQKSPQPKPKAKAKGIAKSSAKPRPVKPVALDPSKLVIDPQAFIGPKGQPLRQIAISQIGPFSEGLVLCDVSEAEAFLKAGTTVTTQPLALLLLNCDESQLDTSLSWASIRMVVRCKANNDPMLVPAVMVHLSTEYVQQKIDVNLQEIPQVEAACLKIVVFRDAVVTAWEDIVHAPVRFLLNALEPLQACQVPLDQACSCAKWHLTKTSPVEDPLLDVWRRQWLTAAYKPVDAMKADLFVVNIRCVAAQTKHLLPLSGRLGIFLEPRTLDSRLPSPSFQVIWMPRVDLAELCRVQQLQPLVQGLARVGQRLGLRVATEDAPALAQAVKPSSVYLGSGEKQLFEVGPLPFGVDRMLVSKLRQSWHWQARPLHPARAVDGSLGTVWTVQACVAPPSNVQSYRGGEVVISKIETKLSAAPSPPKASLVAPSTTVGLCALPGPSSTSGEDPWLKTDPWKPSTSAPSASTVCSSSSLQVMDDRIAKALDARLQMDVDDDAQAELNARVIALEQHVQSLASHQQQLECKFDESSKQTDLRLCTLQSQVGHELEKQACHMQDLFAKQLLQIESLLSKGGRGE